jgi:hypothetical protein
VHLLEPEGVEEIKPCRTQVSMLYSMPAGRSV